MHSPVPLEKSTAAGSRAVLPRRTQVRGNDPTVPAAIHGAAGSNSSLASADRMQRLPNPRHRCR